MRGFYDSGSGDGGHRSRGSYRGNGYYRPRYHYSSRPPPHPQHVSVPLWERRFCIDGCGIPWRKLCESKNLSYIYKNVMDWDDSAAYEAFQKAKSRFWAYYHSQPCNIPLPDPDMYIDIVDQDTIIDPELVADLEKSLSYHPPTESISDAYPHSSLPPTGWGDADEVDCGTPQQSVCWDSYIEQPDQNTGCGNQPHPSVWEDGVETSNPWNCSHEGDWGKQVVQPNWGSGNTNGWANWWSYPTGVSSDGHAKSSKRGNGRKRNVGGGSSFVPSARKQQHHKDHGGWADYRPVNNDINNNVSSYGYYMRAPYPSQPLRL